MTSSEASGWVNQFNLCTTKEVSPVRSTTTHSLDEHGRRPIVFGGSSSTHLSADICKRLGLAEGKIDIRRFSDGEIRVKINENVRGANCFVVQSTYTPVNENLMELLLIIDALEARVGAARSTPSSRTSATRARTARTRGACRCRRSWSRT